MPGPDSRTRKPRRPASEDDWVTSSGDELEQGGGFSQGGPGGAPAGDSSSWGAKYNPWTPEEDDRLRKAVARHGGSHWPTIAAYLPAHRNAKSCRLRWMNHLREDIKKGSFTPEEDRMIIEGHRKFGNKWTRIAQDLPGRTDNAIKNRWHSTLYRRLQQQTEVRKQLRSAAAFSQAAGQPEAAAMLTSLADGDFLHDPERVEQLRILMGAGRGMRPGGTAPPSGSEATVDLTNLLSAHMPVIAPPPPRFDACGQDTAPVPGVAGTGAYAMRGGDLERHVLAALDHAAVHEPASDGFADAGGTAGSEHATEPRMSWAGGSALAGQLDIAPTPSFRSEGARTARHTPRPWSHTQQLSALLSPRHEPTPLDAGTSAGTCFTAPGSAQPASVNSSSGAMSHCVPPMCPTPAIPWGGEPRAGPGAALRVVVSPGDRPGSPLMSPPSGQKRPHQPGTDQDIDTLLRSMQPVQLLWLAHAKRAQAAGQALPPLPACGLPPAIQAMISRLPRSAFTPTAPAPAGARETGPPEPPVSAAALQRAALDGLEPAAPCDETSPGKRQKRQSLSSPSSVAGARSRLDMDAHVSGAVGGAAGEYGQQRAVVSGHLTACETSGEEQQPAASEGHAQHAHRALPAVPPAVHPGSVSARGCVPAVYPHAPPAEPEPEQSDASHRARGRASNMSSGHVGEGGAWDLARQDYSHHHQHATPRAATAPPFAPSLAGDGAAVTAHTPGGLPMPVPMLMQLASVGLQALAQQHTGGMLPSAMPRAPALAPPVPAYNVHASSEQQVQQARSHMQAHMLQMFLQQNAGAVARGVRDGSNSGGRAAGRAQPPADGGCDDDALLPVRHSGSLAGRHSLTTVAQCGLVPGSPRGLSSASHALALPARCSAGAGAAHTSAQPPLNAVTAAAAAVMQQDAHLHSLVWDGELDAEQLLMASPFGSLADMRGLTLPTTAALGPGASGLPLTPRATAGAGGAGDLAEPPSLAALLNGSPIKQHCSAGWSGAGPLQRELQVVPPAGCGLQTDPTVELSKSGAQLSAGVTVVEGGVLRKQDSRVSDPAACGQGGVTD